jgi:MFS family permease
VSAAGRWGIPAVRGHGRFVAATGIDSIGTGLVTTFIIIYFVRTTSLSLVTIGSSLSLARLLALPVPLLVGPLIDRFGARRTAAAGNLLVAAGFTGYLVAGHPWQIVAMSFLVQAGQATYWTSSSPLVVLAAAPRDRTRWFGFVHALRNAGLGLGAAAGSLSLGFSGTAGLHAIMAGNAVSCVVAAVLLTRWHPEPGATGPAATATAVPAGYGTVLRDGRYLLLIGVNVTFVFSALVVNVLLALYIDQGLHRGAWIAGVLLVLNTVQIVLTQTAITRRTERYRPTRVLIAASLVHVVSFVLFAALDVAPGWSVVAGLFLAMAVLTVGESLSAPPTDHLSVDLAPEHLRGRYLAVYQLSWTFGQVTAPLLFSLLFSRGPAVPLLALIAISLASVPLLLLLERTDRRVRAMNRSLVNETS